MTRYEASDAALSPGTDMLRKKPGIRNQTEKGLLNRAKIHFPRTESSTLEVVPGVLCVGWPRLRHLYFKRDHSVYKLPEDLV